MLGLSLEVGADPRLLSVDRATIICLWYASIMAEPETRWNEIGRMRNEVEVRAMVADRKMKLEMAARAGDVLPMDVLGNQISILEWVLGAAYGPESSG